jgi:hypothetical protein
MPRPINNLGNQNTTEAMPTPRLRLHNLNHTSDYTNNAMFVKCVQSLGRCARSASCIKHVELGDP